MLKCFFLIVRRNIGMLVMYTAIFIGIAGGISNAVQQTGHTDFEDAQIPLTVIDRDGSELSRGLEDYLYARQKAVPLKDDAEELQEALYRRATEYILYIPKGFGDALATGEDPPALESVKVPDSYEAAYADEQVKGYLNTLRAYLAAGFTPADAFSATTADLGVEVDTALSSGETQAVSGILYFFQYLCYGLGMVMIFGLAPVLLSLGKREVAARLNASPLPLRKRNAQLAAGAFILAVACYAVFILIACIRYGGELFTVGSLYCLLNGAAFLVFSVALGLLLGVLSKNTNMISALSNVIVLGMCFLGGVYIPSYLLAPATQTVAKFLPTYWYIEAVNAAATLTSPTAEALRSIWTGIGMQLVFALAVFSVMLVISRQKQKVA